MQELTIFVGGDLVPTESNKDMFINSKVELLIGSELRTLLSKGDYRIFNLETPLTDKLSPIDKCGPNLAAAEATVNGISAIGADILNLANNHILDQGNSALESTINILEKNRIRHLGAGMNLFEAANPLIIELGEKRIGVYACAEHEFTIAGENHPGANPFDPLESMDHIVKLRKDDCDYIIVLYHGGKEHYRYPSPYLQKVCRKMVDKGANLIVCQHSHCIGCRENYNNSTIIYGQGNFLFDLSDDELWQTSLILEVSIEDGFFVKEIPIVKRQNCIRMAKGKDAENILKNYRDRSLQILEDRFVDREYSKFASSMLNGYLGAFLGGSLLVRILNRLFLRKLYKSIYSKHSLLMLQNFIECEAHRELLLSGLKEHISKYK